MSLLWALVAIEADRAFAPPIPAEWCPIWPSRPINAGRPLIETPFASERFEKFNVRCAAEREHTGVERDELHLVSSRERQEMRVGYLPMSGQPRHVLVCQRDVVDQESMVASSAEGLQHATGVLDTNRAREHGWVGRDANKSAFG